jgi:hypothetical protein
MGFLEKKMERRQGCPRKGRNIARRGRIAAAAYAAR